MQNRLRKCCDVSESNLYSPFGRVGLSGPERALPGRYRVRPSRKREGEATASSCRPLKIGIWLLIALFSRSNTLRRRSRL